MQLRSILLCLGLACFVANAQSAPGAVPAWTPAQLRAVAALGPWPPAPTTDPSNRVSGQLQAIELGRRLFRDPRMSPVGYIACVTCHVPDRAFSDQRARAHGLADLPRNTPALANLRQRKWFGWDGSSDSLWLASIRPMLDDREFDGTPTSITRIFERDPELAACYQQVFGAAPVRDAPRTIVDVGKALAAYQETLVTGRTGFDDFRDALARRDAQAMAAYPPAAQRGLQVFVGAGACAGCHSGPNFSDDGFHAVLGKARIVLAQADRGRLDGVRRLSGEAMNLQGRFNDGPALARPAKVARALAPDQLRDRFRTPGLRNVGVTGPYMHDGRFDRLQDTLAHGPAKGRLSAAQQDDLLAFLDSLTDSYGERRPWSSAPLASCP